MPLTYTHSGFQDLVIPQHTGKGVRCARDIPWGKVSDREERTDGNGGLFQGNRLAVYDIKERDAIPGEVELYQHQLALKFIQMYSGFYTCFSTRETFHRGEREKIAVTGAMKPHPSFADQPLHF